VNECYQTEGERLFAAYLEQQLGLHRGRDWDYEPEIIAGSKRPDFGIRTTSPSLLLDSKDFADPTPSEMQAILSVRMRAFDPYVKIREKLNAAAVKFRRFKGRHPCGVILRSGFDVDEQTDDVTTIFASMLGDIGFSWPIDEDGNGRSDLGHGAFLDNGKMVNAKSKGPQNTTIGAIVVLRTVSLHDVAYEVVRPTVPAEPLRGRMERVTLATSAIEVRGLVADARIAGVRVHLNPFTMPPNQVSFPHDVFCGQVDEVWRYDFRAGRIECVFEGAALANAKVVGADVSRVVAADLVRMRASELG
jgi:hypothetical protein